MQEVGERYASERCDTAMRLFEHRPHYYAPINVNMQHEGQQTLNDRIAVFLTRVVGSMPTAYIFVAISFIGLFGILGIFAPIVALLVAWASQTMIQLTLLPVIMVGQNVLNQKQADMAEEQFGLTERIFHETDQLVEHMHAQDAELIQLRLDVAELRTMIEQLLQRRGRVRVRMPVVIEQAAQEQREEQGNG